MDCIPIVSDTYVVRFAIMTFYVVHIQDCIFRHFGFKKSDVPVSLQTGNGRLLRKTSGSDGREVFPFLIV